MQHSQALYLFNEGRNYQSYRLLGAFAEKGGVTFRVWAPNASRVAVVGDFNDWDGRRHPLHCLGASGVWEGFVAEAQPGSLYRFELTNRATGALLVKSDPYARGFEKRPGSAAYVVPPTAHAWGDADWLAERTTSDWLHFPCNVY